jgi:hypothetical protein
MIIKKIIPLNVRVHAPPGSTGQKKINMTKRMAINKKKVGGMDVSVKILCLEKGVWSFCYFG